MAQKRDLLDDIIDIQADWQKLSNPFGDIADSLALDPDERPVFRPSDYKQKPSGVALRCQRCASDNPDVCSRCVDVCPVNAISFGKNSIKISDDCRKCGLCTAVCPTEAFQAKILKPQTLYDKIARAASAYEECYVTCTRALKRIPLGNEICLPCVGAISKELWFAILADYVNVKVYLPMGICDRCKTTTGEEFYAEQIATAEEWAESAVGLEVDEADLTHELTRAYKRSQFVSGALTSAERLMLRTNPMLAGAKAISDKLNAHSKQLDAITKEIEGAVGAKTSANRQRVLMNHRKLVLAALQHDPGLGENIPFEAPICDTSLCSMCGDCAKTCTTRAIDLDRAGRLTIESQYCVGCRACITVCPEGALEMEPVDPDSLIVIDKAQIQAAAAKAKAKEEAARLKEKGKEQLGRVGDMLERLAEDE